MTRPHDASNDGLTILAEHDSPPSTCSYLPHETSSLRYREIEAMSAEAYDDYLQRGWRRHSLYFFRPVCHRCRQCRSLRVNVQGFRPSKSQRRAWKKNRGLDVKIGRPDVSRSHLELFNRYHADMHQRKGWPFRETNTEEYIASFLLGQFPFAYEFRYFDDHQLVGLGLVDMTGKSASSVYFYHAPEYRDRALGVFSMLVELQVASDFEIEHHYLGYWIEACGSMAYKSKYRPHEILEDYVDPPRQPVWQPGPN